MKLTPDEELTIKTYDTNAEAWVSEHSSSGFWAEEMKTFKKLLPEGRIIEIGSGGGRDAKELIEVGYDYVGTDVSEGLLKQARKVNPNATFEHKSVYDLDYPENSFDGFWTSATLLHIPKSLIDEALRSIYRVVRPEGVGFISIKKGEGEKIEIDEPQMEGERKRLFSYYSQDEFKEVLERNGYGVVEESIRPMNERTTWLIYFVKVIKPRQG